jgi:hypothetical protein
LLQVEPQTPPTQGYGEQLCVLPGTQVPSPSQLEGCVALVPTQLPGAHTVPGE